jgi:hypothetical protein
MEKPGSGRRGWSGGLVLVLAATLGAGAGPAGDREPPSAEWAALAVRVLSGAGEPVAGAQVFAIERDDRHSFDGRSNRGETDAAGRAVLGKLRPFHLYSVTVFAPGRPAVVFDRVLVVPGSGDLVVRPAGGLRILGRVVGPGGAPVPGAKVRLRRPGNVLFDLLSSCVSDFEVPFAPEAESDAAGDFALGPVGEGVWGLCASAPGATGFRSGVRAGAGPVEIRLAPTRAVVAEGICDFLRGAEAELDGCDVPIRFAARVDAGGRLAFPEVPPGYYSLHFPRVIAAAGRSVGVAVEPGSGAPVSLAVPEVGPGETVEFAGAVLGSDGRAAPGARVALLIEEHGRLIFLAQARAGGEGRFRLSAPARLSGRAFRVVGSLDDAVGVSARLGPGDVAEVRLDRLAGSLSVRVLDDGTGRPLPGARVSIVGLLTDLRGVVTGEDGRVPPAGGLLPRDLLGEEAAVGASNPPRAIFTPGLAKVVLEGGPFFLPAQEIVETHPGTAITVRLWRAPVVTGRVRDPAGRPAAGIRVRTRDGDADTGEDGRFVLLGGRLDGNHEDLRWSPVPDHGDFDRLPALAPGEGEEEYLLPDARRWPLEVFVPGRFEGSTLLVALPGAPAGSGPRPVCVDQDGIGRPGEVPAGRYLVRLLEGPKLAHEEEIVLEADPGGGRWRRTLALPAGEGEGR